MARAEEAGTSVNVGTRWGVLSFRFSIFFAKTSSKVKDFYLFRFFIFFAKTLSKVDASRQGRSHTRALCWNYRQKPELDRDRQRRSEKLWNKDLNNTCFVPGAWGVWLRGGGLQAGADSHLPCQCGYRGDQSDHLQLGGSITWGGHSVLICR